MNTLKDLLELALEDVQEAEPGADPAGDVRRGRQMLRRRRLAGASGLAAAVAAAVLLPVLLGHGTGGTAATSGRNRPSASATPTVNRNRSIALVAYTGDQPPGYQVAEVPTGWVIQGGNQFALVIGPQGDPDTNIGSFVGKLVVMLKSRDAAAPTTGESDPVNGHPGFLTVQGDVQILIFQRADGRWVVIQAPTLLGWDAAQISQFASGVQVLGNAEPSRG